VQGASIKTSKSLSGVSCVAFLFLHLNFDLFLHCHTPGHISLVCLSVWPVYMYKEECVEHCMGNTHKTATRNKNGELGGEKKDALKSFGCAYAT
jgi:hypothetical protein